jgi:uncharacterized protein (DUF2141 family)
MKTRFLTIIFLFIGVMAFAQTYTLTVTIKDLKNDKGQVMIKLVDPDQNIIKGLIVPIMDKQCIVRIEDLPAGTYALSYFHDENKNEKLDMKSWGPPAEGYGFSNNARGMFGPPKFKDQLFELKSDLSMTLETDN